MAKRLREGEQERQADKGRAEALVRATRERHERQQKYVDWQWRQVAVVWLLLAQDDCWLPYDLRETFLRDCVQVLFERLVSRRFKIYPIQSSWFSNDGWVSIDFASLHYDAFLRDVLVKPYVTHGEMVTTELQYQIADRRTKGAVTINAWRPIGGVDDFVACLEASRVPGTRIYFSYTLIAPLLLALVK